MASVVLVIGGECTGKTALAQALADHLTGSPVSVVPETLREFVSRTGRTPRRDEQEGIWREQARLLDHALSDSPDEGVVICDPAPLMTAVYSLQYFDDDSLMEHALAAIESSDLVVWCAPDIPWEPDGVQRDGPDARQRTHELITEHVVPHIQHARVVQVSGGLDERLARTLAHLP